MLTKEEIKTKSFSFRTTDVPFIDDISMEEGTVDINWCLNINHVMDGINSITGEIKSITGLRLNGRGITLTNWQIKPLTPDSFIDIKPKRVYIDSIQETIEVEF